MNDGTKYEMKPSWSKHLIDGEVNDSKERKGMSAGNKNVRIARCGGKRS